MNPNSKPLFLIAALCSVAYSAYSQPEPAPDGGHWALKKTQVSAGGNRWLYLYADIQACLVDDKGDASFSKARFMQIINRSKHSCYISSIGAGQHGQEVPAGKTKRFPLTIYNYKGEPLDLDVFYWMPGPYPGQR